MKFKYFHDHANPENYTLNPILYNNMMLYSQNQDVLLFTSCFVFFMLQFGILLYFLK